MYLVEYSLEYGKLNGDVSPEGEPMVDVTAIRGYFKSKSKKKEAMYAKLKKAEPNLDYTMIANLNFNFQRI